MIISDSITPLSGIVEGGIGSSNSVTVTSSGDVTGAVVGGNSVSGATANNNTVTLEDGAVVSDWVKGGVSGVYGGIPGTIASNNTVILKGGAEVSTFGVWGGNAYGGSATNNSVIIDGDAFSVTGEVLGGDAVDSANAGATGSVANNSVSITGRGALTPDITGDVIGGRINDTSGAGSVSGNSVSISALDTSILGITGDVIGGTTNGVGNATGNSVTLYGASTASLTIGGDVVGGETTGTGDATGNTVNLLGGAYGNLAVYGGKGAVNATNNTVNIGDGFAIADLLNVSLYGSDAGGSGDLVTGNTLNFSAGVLKGTQVADIGRFQFVNIGEIPGTMLVGDTMIDNAAGDFTGTTVNVLGINIASSLTTGDTVKLFTDGTGYVAPAAPGTVQKGMAEVFEATYALDGGGAITLTLGARSVNRSAGNLSLGQISAVSFADRGGDLIAYSAYSAYNAAAAAEAFAADCDELCGGGKFTAFAAAAGAFGSQDYGSGRVDIDGLNFLAGLGYSHYTARNCPSWLLAAFFEGGFGKYEDRPNADGDLGYFGGGILARIDSGNGFYAEASGRVGQLTNDFNSDAIRNPGTGANARYDDLHSTYYGAHAGIGYAFMAGASTFDFSAKYLWTHANSKSVVILAENVDFDAINSQRLRLGGRWSLDTGSCASPYVGAAYEHQFDGKAGTTVSGVRVPDNELKGSSGIVDAGVRFRAASDRVNASVGAYAAFGARREFGARVFLAIDF